MTFNPSIPRPADLLSNSQGQLLSNNAALDTSFAVDHTLFSATANNGMHNKVTLYTSLGAPPYTPIPSLTSPASLLYSQTNGTGATAITNLFYSCIQNNVQKYLQMTGLTASSWTNTGTGAGNGYTLVTPWGLTIMWGQTSIGLSKPTVIFPTAVVNSTYALQLTLIGQTNSIAEVAKSDTQFQAKITTDNPGTMEWLVLVSP